MFYFLVAVLFMMFHVFSVSISWSIFASIFEGSRVQKDTQNPAWTAMFGQRASRWRTAGLKTAPKIAHMPPPASKIPFGAVLNNISIDFQIPPAPNWLQNGIQNRPSSAKMQSWSHTSAFIISAVAGPRLCRAKQILIFLFNNILIIY